MANAKYSYCIRTMTNKSVNEDQAVVVQKGADVVLCVCDGHGGPLASRYVVQNLPQRLLTYRGNVVQMIRRLDVDLLHHLPPHERAQGTTLSCMLYRPSSGIKVWNLGDSAIYIYVRYPLASAVKTYRWPKTRSRRYSKSSPSILYCLSTLTWPSSHTRAPLSLSVNMGSALGDWTMKNRHVYETYCKGLRQPCKPWEEEARRAWCRDGRLGIQICDPWPSTKAFRDFGGDDDSDEDRQGFLSNTAQVIHIPARDIDEMKKEGAQILVMGMSDGITDNLVCSRDTDEAVDVFLAEWINDLYGLALSPSILPGLTHELVRFANGHNYKPDDMTLVTLLL